MYDVQTLPQVNSRSASTKTRKMFNTHTIPLKYQATCEEELKRSSISYCDASILEQSKYLVSWLVAADSLELSATVFTEHDLKAEQSFISLKGRTPQNEKFW